MKVVDEYVVQYETKAGTVIGSTHNSLPDAMNTHNSAISAGAVGSGVFSDDGDEITTYGEGAALVWGRSSAKKINPAPGAKT